MKLNLKKIPWEKRFIQAVWILFGIGAMVLFGAAMVKKNQKNTIKPLKLRKLKLQHFFLVLKLMLIHIWQNDNN